MTWNLIDDKSPSEAITTRIGAVLKTTKTSESERTVLESQDSEVGFVSPSSQLSLADKVRLDKELIDASKASLSSCPAIAFLSLWDMGGHTSFQASHNIFISSHGVYLLVFRLTDFLRDKLETDRLKKWIRMIGTSSAVELNAPRLKPHDPPLIFIGTFLDKLRKKNKDYGKQVQAIRSSIAKFPELSAHKFVKFCAVDNSLGNNDRELEILRGYITEAAVHQDQWDRELPTTWLKLEKDLLDAREKGTRILTLAEVVELNKRSFAPLADVEEIKLALEYLHCTRSVIYFREFDHIINDPQWLADFFSILITDDEFLPKDDLLMTRDLELYTTKGELTHELINGLLSLEKNKVFLPYKSVLLPLMEKFGLIVRLLMTPPTTETAQFSESYTMPSKLTEFQEQYINGITDDVSNLQQRNLAVSNTVCLVFNNEYVPEELFHRIFAHILRRYRATSISTHNFRKMKVAEIGQTTMSSAICLYRGFGCFEVDDLCRMILSMHAERSTIAVTLISPTQSRLQEDSGKRIRLSIEGIIQDTLLMSNQEHFQYTHQLHCNFYLSPYDTPVELYGVIHSENGVSCKGGECRGQHRLSKTDMTFWDIKDDSSTVSGEENATDMTEYGTSISNRRPTPQELGRLSRLVNAPDCWMLFVVLGLSYPEIGSTQWESSSLAVITQITKMFLKWTNMYPAQTFHNIELAMAEAGMATDGIIGVVKTEEESPSVKAMLPKEIWSRAPSDAEIKEIVANIGNTFFNLCLELGLSPPIIEQHELGQPVTFQERMCALLQCWIDKFQTKATIGRLLTAMEVCQMDWHTTAQIWSGRQVAVLQKKDSRKSRHDKCILS